LARATAIPSRGAHAKRVDLELSEGGQDVAEHLAHRVGWVVDHRAQLRPDASRDEGVADRAGVGHRAGEPVELGRHEGVAGADRGEGLVQAGPDAVVPE
jgi:hypothetical protein